MILNLEVDTVPIIKHQDASTREGSSPGLEVRDLVDAECGSESLKIGVVTVSPNSRIPRHIHTNTEEAMVILEGKLDLVLGRQRATVEVGQTVLAPAGTTHGFTNPYPEPAKILFVFPTQNADRVLSSVPGTTSGFPSTQGLAGYSSPQDRPLEPRA